MGVNRRQMCKWISTISTTKGTAKEQSKGVLTFGQKTKEKKCEGGPCLVLFMSGGSLCPFLNGYNIEEIVKRGKLRGTHFTRETHKRRRGEGRCV